MSSKPLSLTIGITTCYGSDSLLETVRSIRQSINVEPFRFIIIADSVPLNEMIKAELGALQVEIIENPNRGSQIKKQKQIAVLSTSDITILTQDDVLFEPDALSKILDLFSKNPKITFTCLRNKPLSPETWFESALNVGTDLVHRAAQQWNGGDNFLSVDGRCMAFRTDWLKSLELPETVIGSDAYLYLANKFAGGSYQYLGEAAVFFRNPQSLNEHLRKSSRFQHIETEMKQYFKKCESEFIIPRGALIQAMLSEFIRRPIASTLYIFITLYTRLFTIPRRKALTTLWEVDLSTKKVTLGR